VFEQSGFGIGEAGISESEIYLTDGITPSTTDPLNVEIQKDGL
jgi:hypothetical protein